MGIDLHAFHLIKSQSAVRPLGDVLTIGRQELCVDVGYIEQALGKSISTVDAYCEPVLSALGADSVSSIDFSDYETPTYTGDLNVPIDLGLDFDTVIDSGSLEHVFDIASAFRNLIRFCRVGGRIMHILPVNNLNGHGFWQFSSDLIYTLYSQENGFEDTQVWYASGLKFSEWRKVPHARRGVRVEVVSLEPVILLAVTKKIRHVDCLKVSQPFYQQAWTEQSSSELNVGARSSVVQVLKKLVPVHRGALTNVIRNLLLVFGLASGLSRFSIMRFDKVRAEQPSDNQRV